MRPNAFTRRTAAAALLSGLGGSGHGARSPSVAVRMPRPPYPQPEPTFQTQLLRLALRKAGHTLQLEHAASQSWMRQIRELHGGFVDVAPLPAVEGAYADFKLRRVDLPLRPGLLGLRLFVARQDRLAELAQWTDLASFQRNVRLGYGSDWADAALMRRLGFNLVTARSSEAIYDLLQTGQCDVLSRGLNEVDTELAHFGQPVHSPHPLAVVPDVALHYPLDDCFFVSPGRADLHQALTLGQRRAVQDGSWARLVAGWYGAVLRRNGMAQRQLWSLPAYPAPAGVPSQLLDLPHWLPTLLHPVPR